MFFTSIKDCVKSYRWGLYAYLLGVWLVAAVDVQHHSVLQLSGRQDTVGGFDEDVVTVNSVIGSYRRRAWGDGRRVVVWKFLSQFVLHVLVWKWWRICDLVLQNACGQREVKNECIKILSQRTLLVILFLGLPHNSWPIVSRIEVAWSSKFSLVG